MFNELINDKNSSKMRQIIDKYCEALSFMGQENYSI